MAVSMNEIEAVYERLAKATEAEFIAVSKTVAAKQQYEVSKAQKICAGVEGKNAAERDAALDLMLTIETDVLVTAQNNEAQARLERTLADQQRSMYRMLVDYYAANVADGA